VLRKRVLTVVLATALQVHGPVFAQDCLPLWQTLVKLTH
jgi:hypothetical protein